MNVQTILMRVGQAVSWPVSIGLLALVLMTNIMGCASAGSGSASRTTPGSGGGGGGLLPWQNSGLKIGYIRSDVISKEYAEYRDAENALQDENRRWQEETEQQEEEITRKQTELDDLALILSEKRKQQLQEEITRLRKDLQKFRHDTWYDENSNYIQRRRELMEPIDARVNDAIWIVAEDRGLDVVFDTVAGNIVFVKPELDITRNVLEELKK